MLAQTKRSHDESEAEPAPASTLDSAATAPSRDTLTFDQLVWAKLPGFSWWPAVAAKFTEGDAALFKCVFFGSYDIGSKLKPSMVIPFDPAVSAPGGGLKPTSTQRMRTNYQNALTEINAFMISKEVPAALQKVVERLQKERLDELEDAAAGDDNDVVLVKKSAASPKKPSAASGTAAGTAGTAAGKSGAAAGSKGKVAAPGPTAQSKAAASVAKAATVAAVSTRRPALPRLPRGGPRPSPSSERRAVTTDILSHLGLCTAREAAALAELVRAGGLVAHPLVFGPPEPVSTSMVAAAYAALQPKSESQPKAGEVKPAAPPKPKAAATAGAPASSAPGSASAAPAAAAAATPASAAAPAASASASAAAGPPKKKHKALDGSGVITAAAAATAAAPSVRAPAAAGGVTESGAKRPRPWSSEEVAALEAAVSVFLTAGANVAGLPWSRLAAGSAVFEGRKGRDLANKYKRLMEAREAKLAGAGASAVASTGAAPMDSS